jgi:hypothetical protein
MQQDPPLEISIFKNEHYKKLQVKIKTPKAVTYQV